jgi:ABC-type amino acid transport substrate-binding protein
MRTLCRAVSLLLLCVPFAVGTAVAQTDGAKREPAADSNHPRELSIANKPWFGDFDKLLERRMFRVLVPYSRSLYYTDKGRERGLTAELVRDFEQYVNRKYRTGKRPITIYLIPTTRDKLLPDLVDGLGDIAAGSVTVTDERMKIVDFVTQTDRPPVKELVVVGPRRRPFQPWMRWRPLGPRAQGVELLREPRHAQCPLQK